MRLVPSNSPEGSLFPLHDHDPKITDRELRACILFCKITKRKTETGDLGHYIVKDEDTGDLVSGVIWAREKAGGRPIPGVMFPWGSQVVDKPKEKNNSFGRGGDLMLLPTVAEEQVDPRFQRLSIPRLAQDHPKIVGGWHGLVTAGSTEDEQVELFYDTDPRLMSAWRAGGFEYSSVLVDAEDQNGEPWASSEVRSRISSFWRVCHDLGQYAPAWNLTQSPDGSGYGFTYGVPDGGEAPAPRRPGVDADQESIVRAGAGPGGGPGAKPKSGLAVAFGSYEKQGPFHVGHSDDKHKFGKNDDGEAVNPLHLWMGALFYSNKEEDGPLAVTNWRQGSMRGVPTRVQFGWNGSHWDWWTTTPIIPTFDFPDPEGGRPPVVGMPIGGGGPGPPGGPGGGGGPGPPGGGGGGPPGGPGGGGGGPGGAGGGGSPAGGGSGFPEQTIPIQGPIDTIPRWVIERPVGEPGVQGYVPPFVNEGVATLERQIRPAVHPASFMVPELYIGSVRHREYQPYDWRHYENLFPSEAQPISPPAGVFSGQVQIGTDGGVSFIDPPASQSGGVRRNRHWYGSPSRGVTTYHPVNWLPDGDPTWCDSAENAAELGEAWLNLLGCDYYSARLSFGKPLYQGRVKGQYFFKNGSTLQLMATDANGDDDAGNASLTVDGAFIAGAITGSWLNLGSATDAVSTGDLAAHTAASGGFFYDASTVTAKVGLAGTGTISVPGATGNGEQFGSGASATGTVAQAFGSSAVASGQACLASGYHADATGTNSTAVGASAQSTATATTAVGSDANAGHDFAICAGYDATSTKTHQFVIGELGATGYIDEIVFGRGELIFARSAADQLLITAADKGIFSAALDVTTSLAVGTFANVGTTALAVATGDFAAGTSAGSYAFYDQSLSLQTYFAAAGANPRFIGNDADVDHGYTSMPGGASVITNQTAWFINNNSSAAGGMALWGMSDTNASAFDFMGAMDTASPTVPAISFRGCKGSTGGTPDAMAAGEIVMGINNGFSPTTRVMTIYGGGSVNLPLSLTAATGLTFGTTTQPEIYRAAANTLGVESALRVGTAAPLSGAGDFSAGLTGHNWIQWDESGAHFTIHADQGHNPLITGADDDVSTPFSGISGVSANTIYHFSPTGSSSGGGRFHGLTDNNSIAFMVSGWVGSTTPSQPAIVLQGGKQGGGTLPVAMTTTNKVVVVTTGWSPRIDLVDFYASGDVRLKIGDLQFETDVIIGKTAADQLTITADDKTIFSNDAQIIGRLYMGNGTVALPAIAWEDADSNWDGGLSRPAVDVIAMSIQGTSVQQWGATSTKIGDIDNSDYTDINNATGQLTLVGGARVTKRVHLSNAVFSKGGTSPAQVIVGTYTGWEFDISDDSVLNVEVPDDWDTTSDIEVRVCWWINEAYATNNAEVNWQLDWSACPHDESEPVTGPTHTGSDTTGDTDIPATANFLTETSVESIPAASIDDHDLLGLTISRIAIIAGNDPGVLNKPALAHIELRYTANKLGTALP